MGMKQYDEDEVVTPPAAPAVEPTVVPPTETPAAPEGQPANANTQN